MNKYIDIKVKARKNTKESSVVSEVVAEIHKYLSRNDINTIGLSYPNMYPALGNVIRIHGTEEELEKMYDEALWEGFSVSATRIKRIPENVEYVKISRVRNKMNNAKLNRLIRRNSISTEDIKKYRVKMVSSGLDNVYLQLCSETNNNHYKRFMAVSNMTEEVTGVFDMFGMSAVATVPWF